MSPDRLVSDGRVDARGRMVPDSKLGCGKLWNATHQPITSSPIQQQGLSNYQGIGLPRAEFPTASQQVHRCSSTLRGSATPLVRRNVHTIVPAVANQYKPQASPLVTPITQTRSPLSANQPSPVVTPLVYPNGPTVSPTLANNSKLKPLVRPASKTVSPVPASQPQPKVTPLVCLDTETISPALANQRMPLFSKTSDVKSRPKQVIPFLASVLQSKTILDRCVKLLFQKADRNSDGRLSFAELGQAVLDLYQWLQLSLDLSDVETEMRLRNRLRKYDVDGDGMLDSTEFTELCRWILWSTYEELSTTSFKRQGIIKETQQGVPFLFYQIGKKIGAGSFGIVNEVTHHATGSKRVMKTINLARCTQNGCPRDMIDAEIDVLARLDHPNVLRMFEHYRDKQNVYLIIDVCSGGELMDVFKEQAVNGRMIPENWVSRVFRQVLEAVSYIHKKGVIHKDLKFQNVMLRDRATDCMNIHLVHAIVIDVGLAELFGRQHMKHDRSSLISGTVDLMAPEVLMQNFSYKCDIWSVGCMLFAICNPNITFAGNAEPKAYPFPVVATQSDPMGMQSLLAAQRRGVPMHLISAASPGIQEAVKRMLTVDEGLRPSATQCLELPWFTNGADGHGVALSLEQAEAMVLHKKAPQFRRRSALEAAIDLPVPVLDKFAEMFKSMDKDNQGTLSKEEFVSALVEGGVDKDAAEQSVENMGFDDTGHMEFSEFVATVLPKAHELFAQALMIAWQQLDVNHDGYLDTQEVTRMLQSGSIDGIGLPPSSKVDLIIKQIDTSKDGKISFTEFKDYLLHPDDMCVP
eukprot:TRINITY_DN36043_c0_g1_i1.p1 TRINITY_DN36043_c0_g1~~TRINITY_DN36043_c0_g1_i1.p1  ORF type:complete len:947 (-),score=115.66 TRINITY_DN36043_c0_g1_i1:170-2584(-)